MLCVFIVSLPALRERRLSGMGDTSPASHQWLTAPDDADNSDSNGTLFVRELHSILLKLKNYNVDHLIHFFIE